MLEIIHLRNCSIRKVKSEQKELHYFNEKCHQAKVQAVLPSFPEKKIEKALCYFIEPGVLLKAPIIFSHYLSPLPSAMHLAFSYIKVTFASIENEKVLLSLY